MAPTSLLDLPLELQDHIFSLSGPDEVNINLCAVTTPSGDFEDAIVKHDNRNTYSTIKNLSLTCRHIHHRLEQASIARDMAKHTIITMNWRKRPSFDATTYQDGQVPTRGQLRSDLYTSSPHVRIILPAVFKQKFNTQTNKFPNLVGDFIIDVCKYTTSKGKTAWRVEGDELNWGSYTGPAPGYCRTLLDRATHQVDKYVQENLPLIMTDEDLSGSLLNALRRDLVDPEDQHPMASYMDRNFWELVKEPWEEFELATRKTGAWEEWYGKAS